MLAILVSDKDYEYRIGNALLKLNNDEIKIISKLLSDVCDNSLFKIMADINNTYKQYVKTNESSLCIYGDNDLQFENRMLKSLCRINEDELKKAEKMKKEILELRDKVKFLEGRLMKKNIEIINLNAIKCSDDDFDVDIESVIMSLVGNSSTYDEDRLC